MSEPAKTPDKKPVDPVLALLLEQNQRLMALVEKMGRMTDASPVENLLKEKEEEAEYKARMEAMKADIAKPLAQRNLELAEKLYDGPRRFTVSIPKAKEHPAIVIRAHSPEEAEGRYRRFCGINSTDHPLEVVG